MLIAVKCNNVSILISEQSGVSASPVVPVSLSSTADAKKNSPDVVAMLIDIDKLESELRNAQLNTRAYDLDEGSSEAEDETRRLMNDIVVDRSLSLPIDKSQLDSKILAISLMRSHDQKKINPRWDFAEDDEIAEDEGDDVAKIVQIILHKGNGVSVTIQDGKKSSHGR